MSLHHEHLSSVPRSSLGKNLTAASRRFPQLHNICYALGWHTGVTKSSTAIFDHKTSMISVCVELSPKTVVCETRVLRIQKANLRSRFLAAPDRDFQKRHSFADSCLSRRRSTFGPPVSNCPLLNRLRPISGATVSGAFALRDDRPVPPTYAPNPSH